jgi:peroxiredoxin
MNGDPGAQLSDKRPRMKQRRERQIFAALFGLGSVTIAGLTTLIFRVTRRHGEMLLELEDLKRAPTHQPPPAPPPTDQQALLLQYGAPAGSVGMNFELPAVDGNQYTLTLLKGTRTLLIFIAHDCPHSLSLLPALSQLPLAPGQDDLHIAIISTGGMAENRALVERFAIPFPVLVQERNEVADLYFAPSTPMAYLIGSDGLTEVDRLEGAQAILGAAYAAALGQETLPGSKHQPLPPTPDRIDAPLRIGDAMPSFQADRLTGGQLTQSDFVGRRTLLFFFDPFCAPCIELLPDFARIHADPRQPDVVMISRRDPSFTLELTERHKMPYPVAFQEIWEISRQIGAQVVPAAMVVGASLRLESDIAVGQQAISDLHRQLRQGQIERRLVSLSSMLQRR